MFDKLNMIKEIQDLSTKVNPWLFGSALLISLLASLLASLLYIRFYERRGTGSQIHRAFPLLGLSITALFICIQVSLPLSLGLLGALSIVRFRTPIKEPEEVGFIMLVIASSIICATFNFEFLLFLFVPAVLTLWLLEVVRQRRSLGGDGLLLVAVRGADTGAALARIEARVRQQAERVNLESSTARDGLTSLQFSFSGFRGPATALQDELGRETGVAAVNIFFNRPGGAA